MGSPQNQLNNLTGCWVLGAGMLCPKTFSFFRSEFIFSFPPFEWKPQSHSILGEFLLESQYVLGPQFVFLALALLFYYQIERTVFAFFCTVMWNWFPLDVVVEILYGSALFAFPEIGLKDFSSLSTAKYIIYGSIHCFKNARIIEIIDPSTRSSFLFPRPLSIASTDFHKYPLDAI